MWLVPSAAVLVSMSGCTVSANLQQFVADFARSALAAFLF